MHLGMDLSLKQTQTLSFQMIQSLKLLQVNTLQLEQLIRHELEMNPVLEAEETQEEENEPDEEKDEDADAGTEDELEVGEDEIDWEEYLDEGFDLTGRVSDERDPNEKPYEPVAVYSVSLEEHLLNQLAEKKLSERQRLLLHFIVGCLSDDGYLRMGVEDIAENTGAHPVEVEEALEILWQLDPAGVGARTLQECLVLQLRRGGLHDSLAMRMITETWELFEKIRIPDMSRRLGVTPALIQQAMDIFKTLNPRPGAQVNQDRASLIIPDLVVEKIDGKWIIYLNDRGIPSLHINRAYSSMIRRGSTAKKEVKEYVRERLNGATWLIRSIEQRKSTMIRVMSAIVECQPDFFEKGPPNLVPLKLQDVADMVEMHISTISRVTSGKYVQTPHGIFELKYFFTEGLGTTVLDGDDISSERIRTRIRELIEGEDTRKPLSDQKISDVLTSEQFKVARRTVAKYREQLRMLPARLRQKYE